jgi:hypothetical protein
MKCIKCIKVAKGYDLDEVRRIADIDADEKVKGGYWKFVPKSEWKLATRKVKVNEVVNTNEPTEELSIEEKKLKRKKNDKQK